MRVAAGITAHSCRLKAHRDADAFAPLHQATARRETRGFARHQRRVAWLWPGSEQHPEGSRLLPKFLSVLSPVREARVLIWLHRLRPQVGKPGGDGFHDGQQARRPGACGSWCQQVGAVLFRMRESGGAGRGAPRSETAPYNGQPPAPTNNVCTQTRCVCAGKDVPKPSKPASLIYCSEKERERVVP